MIVPLLIFAQVGVVQLRTSVSPETVYVGQQVSYDAATLVDDVARRRLRANPSYTPAEVRGASVYDFPFDTASISDVSIGGAHYRRYLYHRALFPLTPGTFDVGPAMLQYALPDDDEYGTPVQSHILQSEPAHFVARALPTSGRPLDFSNAVGDFTLAAHTDGATPRVGDTFVFTVRINGVGDLNLLPRPTLIIPWAMVVDGEERVNWDSTGTVVRGAKEFDWIITPKLPGEMILPPVRYPYFSPTTRSYMVVTTAPVTVTVAQAGATISPPTVRPIHDEIGDSPFPVLLNAIRGNPLVTAAVAIVLLGLILGTIVWIRHRPSDE